MSAETIHALFPRIHFSSHTDEVTAESAEVLSRRWSPIVRMHPSTQFYPISATDYVSHCSPPHNTWHSILSEPRSGFSVSLAPEVDSIRDKHRAGTLPPTVHSIVRRFNDSAPDLSLRGCYLVYYIFLYAHQPDARLFGCCTPLANTGHVADLEWVTVLVAPSGIRRLWTFYSAHGDAESSWVPIDSALDEAETPPAVYVALDVQANYHTPGRKNRIWMVTADLCAQSASSPKLEYSLEVMDPTHPFRRFAGHLGPDGIAAPGRGTGNRFDLPGSTTNHIDTAYSRRMFRFS
jgi:hypothetical protein